MNGKTTLEENINSNHNDEVDIIKAIGILWRARRLIILVTSFFALCSVIFALSLPKFYKSEAILTATGQSNMASSLVGLGGLASMAGIALPSGGEDKATLAIQSIHSRAFLKHLMTFENILPSIMAIKKYDHESRKILFDPKIYDEKNMSWILSKPTYLETFDAYLEQVAISQDPKTRLIFISVEHMSPIFAKKLLDLIIREANELLRNKDLREASDAIAFLTSEIPKSSLITMKDAISQLVQSKLEMQMMAKISTEYVLKVIEPPFVPEKKSKPSRSIICILGTLLGGMLSCLWVLIRYYILDDRKLGLDI